MSSQAIVYGLQVASAVILARLLTPADYGLIAMVTTITGFAGLFRDLGLSAATIQCERLTSEQISTLFWLNVATGSLITLGVAALAPLVAWFYVAPELVAVTLTLSLNFVVASLGVQHTALLIRAMRFGTLALINILCLVLSLAASVLLAQHGAQYWSLVIGSLVGTVSGTVMVWLATRWWPMWPTRGCGIREFADFGAHVTGFNVVNYFHRQLDNILIGRVWGAEQLGLYSRAYSLLLLPITNLREPLRQVAFPALSRLRREPERFRSYFVRYCAILAFMSMPLVAFLFVCSDNLVRLLLGERWLGAAELFAILATAAFVQPVASLRGVALLACGQAKRYFRWGVYNAVVCMTAFACGLPWGAKGVAIAYCVATYGILHPSLVYALAETPIKPRDFYVAVARPAAASLVTVGIVLPLKWQFAQMSDFWVTGACFVVASIVYLGVIGLLPGGRREVADYWTYISVILQKRTFGGGIRASGFQG